MANVSLTEFLPPKPQGKPKLSEFVSQTIPPPTGGQGGFGQVILSGINSVGGALQSAGESLAPVAGAALSPFLRFGATAQAAGRGLYNVATGNLAAEQQAQTVDLTKPEYLRPVQTVREAVGVGGQIGLALAGGDAAQSFKSLVPQAGAKLAGAVAGGGIGTLYGAATGLEKAGAQDMGAVETAKTVGGQALAGGVAGAVTGLAAGALSDWWKGLRGPVPKDTTAKDVISLAAERDASYKPLRDGMGAAAKSAPPSQEQAAKVLVEKSGWKPGDVQDILDLKGEDAKAAQAAVETADRLVQRPSLIAKESVWDNVGENLLKKVDALKSYEKDLSTGMRSLVAEANQPVNPQEVVAAVRGAVQPNGSWTASDVKLYDTIIEKAQTATSLKDLHELRQFIANQTNEFIATAKGVQGGPGDIAAGRMRTALGEYLDNSIDGYADLRRNERIALDALDEFNRMAGGKFQQATKNEALQGAAVRRGAELMRRAQSNTSANLELVLSKLDDASKEFGLSAGGDLRQQAYVTGLIERTWGIKGPTSLQGEVKQAVLGAGDVFRAVANPKETAIKAGTKALQSLGAQRSADALRAVERRAVSDLIRGAMTSVPSELPPSFYQSDTLIGTSPDAKAVLKDAYSTLTTGNRKGAITAISSYLEDIGKGSIEAKKMAEEVISRLLAGKK